MITLLLGSDSLAKQQYIASAVTEQGVIVQKIRAGDTLPNLASLSEPTLFGPATVYVFDGCWKSLDPEELLKQCAENLTLIFIIEETIDQRKTVNKNFVRDKRVTVKEFEAPIGTSSVSRWITKHAKELRVAIEPAAAEALAKNLAPDEHSKLSVLAAHNELLKLRSFAGGDIISVEAVQSLVQSAISIDTFVLLDAIATNNKSRALGLLNDFFNQATGDEKTAAIQISALLADQLRNILLVQDATARNIPEAEILEKTGWKSGRLFVIKKLARHFSPQKIKQTLVKMENLDMELKSSTLPPHVVLDVIISQM